MFLEYCPSGDLKSYLKKNNNKLKVSEAIKYLYFNILIKDFFKISSTVFRFYMKTKSYIGIEYIIYYI